MDTIETCMDIWLQRALHEIDSATTGLSPQQMSWQPAEGKWSACQVLEHLSIAFETTAAALRKVIAAGQPSAGRATFKQWLGTRVVTGLQYFPTGRPAPKFTLPKGAPPEQVARSIREHLVAMDGVLADIERQFGTSVKVADHPVLGPFTVSEWRKFHYVHTHHHMKQIAALRAKSTS